MWVSRLHLEDLRTFSARRCCVLDLVAGSTAHQRPAQRRTRGDTSSSARRSSMWPTQVALGHVVVVALVAGCVTIDPMPTDAIVDFVDDLGVLEDGLQLTDPALHVALLILGGVVVAVLGEVAELPCALDRLGDLDAAPRGEVVVLGLQPLEGGPGELVGRAMREATRLRATGRWPPGRCGPGPDVASSEPRHRPALPPSGAASCQGNRMKHRSR